MPVLPSSPGVSPGLTQTSLDIITSSMRLLHLVAQGEVITAAESQTGLAVLNQMLDSWQIDRLLIYTEAITDMQLVSGQQSYTVGPGGNLDVVRPARIDSVSIIILSNPLNPLEIELEYTVKEAEWQAILLKAIETSWPFFCYDDGGFPQRTLNLWPIPTDANKLRIYSWFPLTQFTDLTTPYTFPPAYPEAIRYNLALRLADEFEGELGPMTMKIAGETLARIKAFNTEIPKLKCDDAVCGGAAMGPNYRAEWFNIP